MKISKYLYGNPIEEWGSQWKDRLLPSARSKVLQKWNASGKKPKPESSNEYTKRRIKEESKRTWRSDVADIAHGIGEGVLALHPYTAIPYYGAKVGQDVLNGNVNWETALNASIPLFHLSPQAVGLREATNVTLEDAANAGSKTARNWRVAREINLNIKNTNIKSPSRYITKDYNYNDDGSVSSIMYLLHDPITGKPLGNGVISSPYSGTKGRPVGWIESENGAKGVSEDIYNIAVEDAKTYGDLGIESGWDLMEPLKTLAVTNKFPHIVVGESEGHPVRLLTGTTNKLQPYFIQLSNHHLVNNNIKYNLKTGNFEEVNPNIINGDKTSLKFFERKPSRISKRERLGIPKGENYYTPELNKAFLKQINDFAKKYGYNILEDKEYSSEQLNSYARALIDRHNKFYRGVIFPSGEDLNLVKKVLGDKATDELILLYVATHSRGEGMSPELYISPTTNAFSYGANGRTAIISRPYKLGKDRTKWFDEGDFNIVETGTVNPKSYNDFLGIVYPWDSPRFQTYNPFLGKKTIPEYYSYLTPQDIIEGEGYYEYIPNPHVQNELISINNPMIFRLWVENPTLETLSKKTPDVPWQLSKITVRKQGGKMNTLLFLKNGSGIHIKKKNRGKFTDYCGGKVTSECIAKGKRSPNAAIRKRATFADNARHFKHRSGGKAFVNGVSILDSNPDAYKYVKKKYKMALEGTKLTFGLKVGNFLNSDLGQFAANAAGQFVNGIWQNKQLNKIKNELNQWKKSYINSITPEDYSLQVAAEEQQLMLENPDYNSSPIVQAYKNNILANNSLAAAKLKAEQEANQVIANYQLNNNLNSFNWGNLLSLGLGLAGQYLSNKKLAT